MIPSDIKITPLSGSEDSSVSMTMEKYTGRVAKPTREVWVYDAENTVSDMVEVDQYPKTEFIGLNDPLTFPVVALGGEITVTGTSNSSALKPVEFNEALEFELSINGEVQSSWSLDNPVITGDIGAGGEYSFSLKVTVPENQSTSQKSWTFQLSNNAQIVTATITINQAAGVRTYSSITVSEFSYPDAPASGGILTPTLSYSQTWGWNGKETGGGTINSGAQIDFQLVLEPEYWDTSVIDEVTGIINAPSRGTTIANREVKTESQCAISLNGKSTNIVTNVYQEANLPVSMVVTPSFTYPTGNIPASGGTKTPSFTGNVALTWSSGEVGGYYEDSSYGYSVVREVTYEMTSAEGFSIDSSTGTITAENRGTTPGAARSCGNVTRTLTVTLIIDKKYGGGTVADTGEYILNSPVTQEANTQTQTGIRIVGDTVGTQGWIPYEYWDNINAKGTASAIPGDDSDISGWAIKFTGYRQYSYTSGATDEETVTNISHSLGAQKNVDWIGYHTYGYALKRQGDSNNAYRGTTIGNERTAEVWWEENGFESNHLSITQAKNVPISGIATSAQFAINSGANPIPASGGTVNFVGRGNANITWSSGAIGAIQVNGTAGYSVVSHRSYLDMSVNTGFTLIGVNVTAKNRGTVVGAARNAGVIRGKLYYTINIDSEYGGGTFDTIPATWDCPEDFVTQEANAITDTEFTIEKYCPDDTWIPVDGWDSVPANGGYLRILGRLNNVYTSGSTAQSVLQGVEEGVASHGSVEWAELYPANGGNQIHVLNRGTTVGDARSGSVYWTYNGLTSNTLEFTQVANQIESSVWGDVELTIDPSTRNSPAAGEIFDVIVTPAQSRTDTYTSGSIGTVNATLFDVVFKSNADWIIAGAMEIITVSENTTTNTRTGTVTFTGSANGKSGTATLTVTQAGVAEYLTVSPETLEFEAAGGTKTITINSNDSWTIS